MVSLLEKVVGFVCDRNYSGDLKLIAIWLDEDQKKNLVFLYRELFTIEVSILTTNYFLSSLLRQKKVPPVVHFVHLAPINNC